MHSLICPIVAELRNKDGEINQIRKGTLEDLHIAGTDPARKRILNALDFPMGYASLPPPPMYR
jgi:hypothetical protein